MPQHWQALLSQVNDMHEAVAPAAAEQVLILRTEGTALRHAEVKCPPHRKGAGDEIVHDNHAILVRGCSGKAITGKGSMYY